MQTITFGQAFDSATDVTINGEVLEIAELGDGRIEITVPGSMTFTGQADHLIEVDQAAFQALLFAEGYQKAMAKGCNGDECVVCGKRTGCNRKASWYVRTDEGIGSLIEIDDPRTEDGGFFPVGPECRRSFPAAYVRRMDLSR